MNGAKLNKEGKNMRQLGFILDTPLDVTSNEKTCEYILSLERKRLPAYVCFATSHMVIEANRRADVCKAYCDAAMVNPDGRPLAWALKLLGHNSAQCVSGPNQTPYLLRQAELQNIKVGFYGGRPETLERMKENLMRDYPNLQISYMYSPPFRELNEGERQQVIDDVTASETRLLFIGLGSIKQEIWMNKNSAELPCICLGVGAVFEFISREKQLPPLWVQELGLTWLVRLCQEPRRLIGRNLYSPVFATMFLLQMLTEFCWRLIGISRSGSLMVRRNLP